VARTALWQAVKKANPDLPDEQIDQLLDRAADQLYDLHKRQGLAFDRAQEIVNADLFPAPVESNRPEP